MIDKLQQLLDSLASAASKITTPISLAALKVLVAALTVLVILLVVYFNPPLIIGITAICAASIVSIITIFTVGIKKGTPPKEDISEPTSFSTDLRVKQEVWEILDGALSSLGFDERRVSEVENLIGMNYEFSWAKGGKFSLFIVQLKPEELTSDAIFQLRGIKDGLKEKRDEHVKILIICDVQQIFDGLHYCVIGSTDLVLLTHYGIHQTAEDPNFLKNLLKLNHL